MGEGVRRLGTKGYQVYQRYTPVQITRRSGVVNSPPGTLGTLGTLGTPSSIRKRIKIEVGIDVRS